MHPTQENKIQDNIEYYNAIKHEFGSKDLSGLIARIANESQKTIPLAKKEELIKKLEFISSNVVELSSTEKSERSLFSRIFDWMFLSNEQAIKQNKLCDTARKNLELLKSELNEIPKREEIRNHIENAKALIQNIDNEQTRLFLSFIEDPIFQEEAADLIKSASNPTFLIPEAALYRIENKFKEMLEKNNGSFEPEVLREAILLAGINKCSAADYLKFIDCHKKAEITPAFSQAISRLKEIGITWWWEKILSKVVENFKGKLQNLEENEKNIVLSLIEDPNFQGKAAAIMKNPSDLSRYAFINQEYQIIKDFKGELFQITILLAGINKCSIYDSVNYVKAGDDRPVIPLSKTIPRPPLKVTEMTDRNKTEIMKTLDQWNTLAHQKYLAIHGGKYPQYITRTQNDRDPALMFKAALNMIQTINYNLNTPIEKRAAGGEAWDNCLVCRNEMGKIQSIALIEKSTNKLAYVVTHPNNIAHPINNEVAIKGAGTEIVLALAARALATGTAVNLNATKDAKAFYFKLHFDQVGKEDFVYDITQMELSVDKIKELVSEGKPPFNRLRVV